MNPTTFLVRSSWGPSGDRKSLARRERLISNSISSAGPTAGYLWASGEQLCCCKLSSFVARVLRVANTNECQKFHVLHDCQSRACQRLCLPSTSFVVVVSQITNSRLCSRLRSRFARVCVSIANKLLALYQCRPKEWCVDMNKAHPFA